MQWKGANGLTNLVVSYGRAGQDKQTLDGSAIKEADGLYRATLSDLQAFTSYEFTITGTNAAGSGVSYSGTLATNGYPAEIIVTSGGKPQRSIKVQVVGYEYTTDENGKIYLELPSGNVPIKLVSGSYSRDETLEVKAVSIGADKKASEIQQFSYTIPASALSGRLSLWWLLLPLLLVILLVVFFILKRRKDKQANQPWAPLTGAYVGGAAATTVSVSEPVTPSIYTTTADNAALGSAEIEPTIEQSFITNTQIAFPKPMDAPHSHTETTSSDDEVLDIWQQAEQANEPDSDRQDPLDVTTDQDTVVGQAPDADTVGMSTDIPATETTETAESTEPTKQKNNEPSIKPHETVDLDIQTEGEMEIKR